MAIRLALSSYIVMSGVMAAVVASRPCEAAERVAGPSEKIPVDLHLTGGATAFVRPTNEGSFGGILDVKATVRHGHLAFGGLGEWGVDYYSTFSHLSVAPTVGMTTPSSMRVFRANLLAAPGVHIFWNDRTSAGFLPFLGARAFVGVDLGPFTARTQFLVDVDLGRLRGQKDAYDSTPGDVRIGGVRLGAGLSLGVRFEL
jgi:hypothetical protein